MKNFVIAPFPPPLGGVSAAASNLVRVLQRQVADVTVFDTSGHHEREDLYAPKGLPSYLRNLRQFPRFLREVVLRGGRDDAHHLFVTSDRAFYRDFVFLLVLRLLRRRVLVHLHSKPAGEHFVDPRRIARFGRMLSLANRVFVLSPEHAAFFGRYVAPDRLLVLENFVLAEDFAVGRATRPGDMLYVSRLSQMKGTRELLAATDILVNRDGRRGLRVTIAGNADTEQTQAEVETYVREHRLGDCIELAGLVTGDRKRRLFAENGVFVFPSRFENSPVVLKEATQAGMAVIASDIPANLNIVRRSGNALLFPAGDPEALAAAMTRVMDEPGLFAALRAAAAGAPKFDEHYAWSVLREHCVERQPRSVNGRE
ncbi:MAG: glycosyltransferase family 4 protein [Candidatus Krumholzibacteriia bacterium]